MSQIFEFNGAKKYIFGNGSINRLGTEAALLGKKALLVLDPGLPEGEFEDLIADSLEAGDMDHVLFQDFVQEPEPDQADEAAKLARSEGCDLVIGIGGGSAMDLAKAAAVLAKNDGQARDYIGVDLVPKPGPAHDHGAHHGRYWIGGHLDGRLHSCRKDKAKGGINSPHMYPDPGPSGPGTDPDRAPGHDRQPRAWTPCVTPSKVLTPASRPIP